MTQAYEAPDPAIAECVYRSNLECDQQTERLRHASADELKLVVRDPCEPSAARGVALLGLMSHRDPEFTNLVLELFDDADQDLWRMAIIGAQLKDPRILAKLHNLLDDPDENNWSEAAVVLARAGDDSRLDLFTAWLADGDEPHRNVAIECLKNLKNPSAIAALQHFWRSDKGDDESRLVVAAALFESGDACGRELLDSVARRGDGNFSVFAATSIYFVQPRDGLNHMLWILDQGSLDARQVMVNQIWNISKLPHAFTVDGLSEARVWVEAQLRLETLE